MHPVNEALLQEVNAAQAWFPARKFAPVWARVAGSRQRIKTLEGTEEAQKGDYVCRGVKGELWPQKKANFEKKYAPTETVEGLYRKYELRPEAAGVRAAQVGRAFQVFTSWGEQKGEPGDYVLKRESDADIEYPEDIWIVRADVFAQSYVRS